MRTLLLFFLLLAGINFGCTQSEWTKVQGQNLVELRSSMKVSPTLPVSSSFSGLPTVWLTNTVTENTPKNLAAAPIPPAWNYQDLAFFCKLEVKMEKAVNLPIKVRLGEVQAVERKEGKLRTHFDGRRWE